jgi:PAS domain S-box-containing protein
METESGERGNSQRQVDHRSIARVVIGLIALAIILAALYFLSQYNYLLFHSMVEFASIIIALVIFIIVWSSRSILDNYFFLFLGIAFLFIGVLDFFHTMSYKGMGVFPNVTTNVATQVWIAARYMQAFSLLGAFAFLRRKFNPYAVIVGYTVITSLVLTSVFYWKNFPVAYVDGLGLTPFKIGSEYAISLILVCSIVLLVWKRTAFDQKIVYYLLASIVATIASEMTFTLYVDPYGLLNMVGHLLKVITVFSIYKAVVQIGLVQPDKLLFRNLKQNEQQLARQTTTLSQLNTRLSEEIAVRRKVEDALRQQEERYRSTLDNMLEGCQIIGYDWRYLYMNDSAARHGETTRERLVGRTMMEAYPGIENTAMFAQMSRCMAQRTSHRMENQFFYPNGSSRWFELSMQPAPEGLFVLSQDITVRKKTEEQIQLLNQNLLQQSAKLAAMNKELEAFNYSVSHDLRAPLRGIDGFSQVLVEDYADKLDEQGKDYLRRVRNATQRMGQLIDDMLRLSRLSRTEMLFEPVDLTALARTVIEKLQSAEPTRKISVSIQEGLRVTGDAKMLEILLDNLLGNAWKFTSRKKKPLLEFGAVVENGRTVFFVRDNGAGFDMQYEDKLFMPFQRLHSTDEYTGTGIGLAIVARIVHRHQGRVWAQGSVGKGATFFFTIGDEGQP